MGCCYSKSIKTRELNKNMRRSPSRVNDSPSFCEGAVVEFHPNNVNPFVYKVPEVELPKFANERESYEIFENPQKYRRFEGYRIPGDIYQRIEFEQFNSSGKRYRVKRSKGGSCIKRIMRDWSEFKISNYPNIYAEPVKKSNLTLWHANLVGPKGTDFEDAILHVEIQFKGTYPKTPPKVKLLTHIPHSHVISSWEYNVCLDMLETHHSEPNLGWSTAYSLISILIQLQSFLFYDEDRVGDLAMSTIKKTKKEVMSFKCHCGHDMTSNSPWPWKGKKEIEDEVMQVPDFQAIKKNKGVALFQLVPDEVFRYHIFPYLPSFQVHVLRRVCVVFNRLVSEYISPLSSNIVCFHSKTKFNEDDSAILGFGISVKKNPHTKTVQYVDAASIDYLSYTAFKRDKVRLGVWKEKFLHFLPLFIDSEHWARSRKLFNELMKRYTGGYLPHFNVDLLLKLLNTIVIYTLNGENHCSEKFLESYFQIYRLVLQLCIKYEYVVDAADERIERFVHSPFHRAKAVEGNIGNFLQLLVVSKRFRFDDVIPHVLAEQWDRNVMWTFRDYPQLQYSVSSERRILCSWESNSLPCHLLVFNKKFLDLIRPTGDELSMKEVAEKLDSRYGIPPPEIQKLFQDEVFRLRKINSYEKFFKELNWKPVKSVEHTLLDSIANSASKHYHVINPYLRKKPKRVTGKKSWSPWSCVTKIEANKSIISRISLLPEVNVRKDIPLHLFGTDFNHIRFETIEKKQV